MSLIEMKEYLSKLLENFSVVIDLEMTILNIDPFERIAWTGDFFQPESYKKNEAIDEKWKRSYTNQVIQSGKTVIAIDTSEYVASNVRLRSYEGSQYYSLIAAPVYIDGNMEAVIVLASFTENQQRILIEKKEQLLRYIENLTDLIASKYKEKDLLERTMLTKNRLNAVIDTMQEGIILYSKEQGILHINSCAKTYLHYGDDEVQPVLLQELLALSDHFSEKDRSQITEIHKMIGEVQFSLQVQIYAINQSLDNILFIFSPFSKIQNDLTQNTPDVAIERQIIFSSCKMRKTIDQAEIVADNSVSVLITGESGTGKELIARMIHAHGVRRKHPFISVNCAAIPDTLLESELFGYEDGAFTGAKKGGKIGKFLLANHGTLFLDEIGEMPLYLQAKLLRVLSEHQIDRVGGEAPIDVDVRIIAATNRNLEEMIQTKEFRADLYYRLNVVPIHIPPLRERKEDIFVLCKYFIEKYNKILNKKVRRISDEALAVMRAYNWPGNVRELENCIEYMMTFEKGSILSDDNMPSKMKIPEERHIFAPGINIYRPLRENVELLESEIITRLGAEYKNLPLRDQVREICKILDISQASYYRKKGE